jgi:stress-induced morphogen
MEDRIRQKLTSALVPLVLEIRDDSAKHAGHEGMGQQELRNMHFRIKIVSVAFKTLSRLERHRWVHELLADELKGGIHALSLLLEAGDVNR